MHGKVDVLELCRRKGRFVRVFLGESSIVLHSMGGKVDFCYIGGKVNLFDVLYLEILTFLATHELIFHCTSECAADKKVVRAGRFENNV